LISAATATALFVFPRLTACSAALRSRITALPEERLVFGRKGEFLSTVAARELLISSHGESSLD